MSDKKVKNLTVCGDLKLYGNQERIHKIRKLSKKSVEQRKKNGLPEEKYDLIIVGAGTSGCVLINRFAQRYPDKKILVLETGQDDVRKTTGTSVVPNPNAGGGTGPDDWGQLYRSLAGVFGEGCAASQTITNSNPAFPDYNLPRGSQHGFCFGGTSAINGPVWNRGTKEGTYDRWVESSGDNAYGFDSMVDAYKKLEQRTQTTHYEGQDIEYWETNGSVPGRTLNEFMGTKGEIPMVSGIFPGYTRRAFDESLIEAPLPNRDSIIPIDLDDVNPENPVEYSYIGPNRNYDQTSLNFTSNNPYTNSDPGYTYVPPANPGNAKGPEYVGPNPAAPKSREARAYAAPVFLYPVIDKKFPNNVVVKDRAFVTKLIFNECDSTEVIGVEYVQGENGEGWHVAETSRAIQRDQPPYIGTSSGVDRSQCSVSAAVKNQQNVIIQKAYSKTDIWLCAGYLWSPTIVMHSGIGNYEQLSSLGIPVRVDLPGVGEGGKDTLSVPYTIFTEVDLNTYIPPETGAPSVVPEALYADTIYFADPLPFDPTDPNSPPPPATGSITGAAVKTGTQFRFRSDTGKKYANMELLAVVPGIGHFEGGYLWDDITRFATGQGLTPDILNKSIPNPNLTEYGLRLPKPDSTWIWTNGFLSELLTPSSNGNISLISKNPFQEGRWNPNVTGNDADIEAQIDSFINTYLPLFTRMSTKRFGPRGLPGITGPGQSPVDSIDFSGVSDNHRNFVRFANPNGDRIFTPVILTQLTNPFTTKAQSTRVSVKQPNHGYKTGDMIKIEGVVGSVDNISPVLFNDYHIVYKIDDDYYDIILMWNQSTRDGFGGSPTPNPAINSVGMSFIGGSVTISTLRVDRQKLREYIRDHWLVTWHYSRTMKMGKKDNPFAVVDSRARVYNVKGLRVCDTSIFPEKPNGNTQAPAMGIAQKLFDLISVEEYDNLLFY